MSDSPPDPAGELRRFRQKTILIVMSAILFVAGMAVILFLKRLPLPARLAIGLGDVITASVLLVFLRQNYPPANR